jgi:hypothetical protein
VPSFLGDRTLWLRVRYYRQELSKLRFAVPGRFGRKRSLGAREIAAAVKTKALEEAKRVAWKTPPRAKLSVSLLFYSDDHTPSAIHNLVKFYLDELRDIAFADDRQISHLTAGLCRLSLSPPCPNGTTKSDVYIAVERLVDYNRRFDLCFELLDRAYAERELESSECTFDLGEIDESLVVTFPEETRRQMKKSNTIRFRNVCFHIVNWGLMTDRVFIGTCVT